MVIRCTILIMLCGLPRALLRTLGTVVTVIIAVALLNVTAEQDRNNGTGCGQQHGGPRLVPRFLNGHYVRWPVRACAERPAGPTSNCDVNTPPPHVSYEPGNVIFTRMQMAGDRAFIVSPRYKPGVPFTLSYVPLTDCRTSAVGNPTPCNSGNGFHSVSPYPSLQAHCQFSKSSAKTQGGERMCDKEGLVNVVDAYLGPDGVLWVLDIGIVNTLKSTNKLVKPKKYAEPRVVGIDVASGRTVHKIELEALLHSGGDFGDRKTKITAQSLHTIAVEYEEDDTDDYSVGDDSGPSANVPGQVVESKGTTADYKCRSADGPDRSGEPADGNDSDNGSTDRDDGRSGARKYEKVARPVAVYVGDASGGGPDRGSFVAWSVKEARGIRIVLPVSVSAVIGPDGGPDYLDADDHLDVDRNVLHLALLDEPRPAGRAVRHLYITYGRHPDAYKIPVDVIRNRRRGTNDDRPELQLTKCRARGCVTGGNRCLVNVGRKPVGPDSRPLVPLDSANGHLWYYRDSAAAGGAGLYVWDTRQPFHAEHFRRIGGDRGDPSVRDGECTCGTSEHDDGGRQRLVTKTLQRRDRGRTDGRASDTGQGGKAAGGDNDKNDYDDEDEDGDGKCEPCEEPNKTAPAGRQRPQGGAVTWAGCMKITSVDYSCSDPATRDASTGGYGGALWTLHTNIHDWVRGRTGRFGPIALLCPLLSDCNPDR